MEDVLAIYEKTYKATEPVVCLDEKPVSLHSEVRPRRPARPGQLAKRDSEYERCGGANVFCAVEPKAGRHFTFATPDRSGFEFEKVLFHLALQYHKAKTVHLVVDNLNIHTRKSLTDALGEEVGGVSQAWLSFDASHALGIVASTATKSLSTGDSRGNMPARSSITIRTSSASTGAPA